MICVANIFLLCTCKIANILCNDLFFLVLNLALPGIYPPFLLRNGLHLTNEMNNCGASASEFFRKIDERYIKIPLRFIIHDANKNLILTHTNNIEYYWLNAFKAEINETCMILKKLKDNPRESSVSEDEVNESNMDTVDTSNISNASNDNNNDPYASPSHTSGLHCIMANFIGV